MTIDKYFWRRLFGVVGFGVIMLAFGYYANPWLQVVMLICAILGNIYGCRDWPTQDRVCLALITGAAIIVVLGGNILYALSDVSFSLSWIRMLGR